MGWIDASGWTVSTGKSKASGAPPSMFSILVYGAIAFLAWKTLA